MVALKSLSLALLSLGAAVSAGTINLPRQLPYPGCNATPDCRDKELCYKPGRSEWPYGVCIPEGKNATEPGDPDAPQLGYPTCQVVKDCREDEICYKPGSENDPYGVCLWNPPQEGQ